MTFPVLTTMVFVDVIYYIKSSLPAGLEITSPLSAECVFTYRIWILVPPYKSLSVTYLLVSMNKHWDILTLSVSRTHCTWERSDYHGNWHMTWDYHHVTNHMVNSIIRTHTLHTSSVPEASRQHHRLVQMCRGVQVKGHMTQQSVCYMDTVNNLRTWSDRSQTEYHRHCRL